jgi:hypothetical protein
VASNAKLWPDRRSPRITVAFGVPYQLSDQLCAPVQALPGTRISSRARGADRRDRGVRRGEPLLGRHVVRLVHQPEQHARIAANCCATRARSRERGVGTAALPITLPL